MKKLVSVICLIAIIFTFTGCSAFNKYKDESEMQNLFLGTWTTEDGFAQIKIETTEFINTCRDESTYEDTISVSNSLIWNIKEGFLEFNDSDDVYNISEDGKVIFNSYGIAYYKGGELAEQPIPTELLTDAVLKYKYYVGPFSTYFGYICDKIVREIKMDYFPLIEYKDKFSQYDKAVDLEKQLGGEAFIVTVEGEVSMNPDIDYLYTSYGSVAKFLVIVKDGKVVYNAYFELNDTFSSSATIVVVN